MELSREILFFFSGLGAFNGVLLSLYFLIFKKPAYHFNKYLGGLLLVMSIRVGKSVFFYFNEELASVYLQIGLSACFLIGPFLYCYVAATQSAVGESERKRILNLLVWIPVILIINFSYPWSQYLPYWRDYFIPAIYLQWFCYLLAGAWTLRKLVLRLLFEREIPKRSDILVISILVSNSIIWFAYAAFPFVSYIVGALSFSFMLYILILVLFFGKDLDAVKEKYSDKKIEVEEADSMTVELENIMRQEKLYKDPNLTIADVAKKMNISPHKLSQLINDNIGGNYSAYINKHRIEEAKAIIASNDQYTLEAIGYECGFNSKSTFYWFSSGKLFFVSGRGSSFKFLKSRVKCR
ncbi:MAG: helix-turn-helix domain-containing protein, partial [Bacteroidota bacterium]